MTKNKKIVLILIAVIAAIGLAAFLYPDNVAKIRIPDNPSTSIGTLKIDSIDIQVLESFPVQVHVSARGNFPDGCTSIGEIAQERTDTTFLVTIKSSRPAGAACTEALVPFEKTIGLDVYGLKAGAYTVDVNGVEGTFKLTADNVPHDDVKG